MPDAGSQQPTWRGPGMPGAAMGRGLPASAALCPWEGWNPWGDDWGRRAAFYRGTPWQCFPLEIKICFLL